ncbi:MAG: hypothetical protein JXB45_00775 [Candidatus Krumholzibacteriota bacterium]|nr:hypothetical protein [Candidatus Krumholzibacteriota bacterium]
MKGHALKFLFLLMIFAFIPCSAGAQEWPDTLLLEFDFEGFGNMILVSPPHYAGDIIAGDARLVGATWWIEIDDSEWPPTTDPNARWEYIFNTYYEYNSQTGSWTAFFNASTLPAKPTWGIDHPTNGTMGGTLVIASTMGDWDMDGVLDIEERMFATFEGTLMVMKYGTGNFYKYCGSGSYNGALQNYDPANFVDDYVDGSCILDLVNCVISNEHATWGSIKALNQ